MMNNNNNKKKDINIKLGSINCRYILKQYRPQLSDRLTKYLCSQQFDILACQETNFHQSTLEEQTEQIKYKMQQPHQSFWTTKCGIINFNTNINMEQQFISPDQRFILVKLTILGNHNIEPMYVLNMYAPASDENRRRHIFYSEVLEHLKNLNNFGDVLQRMVVMGDFNFSFESNLPSGHSARPKAFMTFMRTHFHDGINSVEDNDYTSTFKRKTNMSCIDYIFVGHQFRSKFFDPFLEFLHPSWTDHALLSIKLRLGKLNTGRGLWRGNPYLVKQDKYVSKIDKGISHFMNNILADSSESSQVKWDRLKGYVRKLTQSYCRNRSSWRQRKLRELQSNRNNLLRRYKSSPELLNDLLPPLENEIATIEHEIAETAILRAGKNWIENNERDVGYLQRTIKQRSVRRQFTNIVHPSTGKDCLTTADKLGAVHHFYQDLYADDPIHRFSLNTLLENINSTISTTNADEIISELDLPTIIEGVQRSPKVSSPGRDGIPYPILRLIIEHPECKDLVYAVYNDALTKAIFPKSWQETCIVMLPKKGDLEDLANWRPISLINTDCKVFTRILNRRVIEASKSIISPYQAGFMPERFIGDHGLALKIMMEDATHLQTASIGIAIDSAKAYDYVNAQYICSVMKKFGFPPQLITCIKTLFFSNNIVVNMNGFFTPTVHQRRGLRQGDAISPILFNIALEPFIRMILNDSDIKGYSVASRPAQAIVHHTSHKPIKVLAYADDLLVIINTRKELERLQTHLECYSRASNSRVNYHKSVAFPLSGDSTRMIPAFRIKIKQLQFQWFDNKSNHYLRYLGYPIYFSHAQRDMYCNETILKLQAAVNIHVSRQISVYGRAHMANSLFLARFWHVLRITALPAYFFRKISSIIYQFVTHKIFPVLKKSVMYYDKLEGGLSVIDISSQQNVLQMRYAKALLQDNQHCAPLPGFLWSLLTSYIQLSFNTTHHQVPLLFKEARHPSQLRGLHTLSPLLKSLDAIERTALPDTTILAASTALELPFLALCRPNVVELPNVFNNASIISSKAFAFLQMGPTGDSLMFQERQTCKHPNLLNRLKNSFTSGTLQFLPFVTIQLPTIQGPSPLYSPVPDFKPCLQSLQYQGVTALSLPHKQLRQLYQGTNRPLLNISAALNRSHMKLFLATNMKSTPRNLWFRLIHNKIPAKANICHILKLPDDRCPYCGQIETSSHLLITCPTHLDIWRNFFHLYIDFTPPLRLDKLYQDIISLKVIHYKLLDSALKINHFELFSSILTSIWNAHWRLHFDQIEIVDQAVLDSSTKLIRYISTLNNLD